MSTHTPLNPRIYVTDGLSRPDCRLPLNGGPCETCGAQFNQPCGLWITWIAESHAELLAVLKAVRSEFSDLASTSIFSGAQEIVDLAEQVDAAIAKAEGRQ